MEGRFRPETRYVTHCPPADSRGSGPDRTLRAKLSRAVRNRDRGAQWRPNTANRRALPAPVRRERQYAALAPGSHGGRVARDWDLKPFVLTFLLRHSSLT